ncbi:MAG: hypothetical protein ABSG38_02380 [Spirochaetia bacterium]|jgi:hypothetical protein
MKITRKLPLVLLAAGMALLLSGCDPMLDGIFPERQIVNVTVEVYAPHHADYVSGYSYVQVQLLDSSGFVLTTLTSFSPTSYNSITGNLNYTFQFNKLKNDTYGLWSLYYGSLTGYYPLPYGGTPTFSVENSGYTNSVTLPYNKSSDITNLTVVIN